MLMAFPPRESGSRFLDAGTIYTNKGLLKNSSITMWWSDGHERSTHSMKLNANNYRPRITDRRACGVRG